MKKILLWILLTSFLYSYELQIDSKNAYFIDGHFRVIVGVSYKDDQDILDYVSLVLNAAKKTWQVEIETLGFIEPRHSDTKKIDIYIGNKQAYNYETESYETISSNYAGWATSYPSDNSPFFLLNNILSNEQIEVTIAHEFFHTIQYAYFDETKINDDKWFKNIWWLEATAVLMEDEVYDDVNDYVRFLSPFFTDSTKSIEIYDGSHEYATVIYAKYLKEKFGFDIIKKTFQRIETSGDKGYFEIIADLLKEDYSTTLQKELLEFAKWCGDPSSPSHFEEGSLYPSITHFTKDTLLSVEKGGIALVDNIDENWSMISLPNGYQKDDNIIYIWEYDNGIWKNNLDVQGYDKITDYNSSKSYWVKSQQNSYMYYTSFDQNDFNVTNLHSGWNFVSFSSKIDASTLTNIRFIWHFENNKWQYFTNQDIQLDDKFSKLTTLYPYQGYWLLY
jgi:hypothetical protein